MCVFVCKWVSVCVCINVFTKVVYGRLIKMMIELNILWKRKKNNYIVLIISIQCRRSRLLVSRIFVISAKKIIPEMMSHKGAESKNEMEYNSWEQKWNISNLHSNFNGDVSSSLIAHQDWSGAISILFFFYFFIKFLHFNEIERLFCHWHCVYV